MSKCKLYSGPLNENGYGRLRVDGKLTYAHRRAYELANGPILPGQLVCHSCDVPACINVEHLFLGTQTDNMKDAARKGRMPRGEKASKAKLVPMEVKAIRLLSSKGFTQQELAKKYGVSQSSVSDILIGASWKHV